MRGLKKEEEEEEMKRDDTTTIETIRKQGLGPLYRPYIGH
jgi:hypothetical protein